MVRRKIICLLQLFRLAQNGVSILAAYSRGLYIIISRLLNMKVAISQYMEISCPSKHITEL